MAKKHGKKFNQAISLIDTDRAYTVKEAVELLDRTNTVKFDPTIEIHFNLAIDPRQADQMVRSTITLPNGTGKTKKIGAFTDLGNEAELKKAGVAVAGGDDLIDLVSQGKIDFDIAIATPGMMRKMGKIARVLGPKGMMPNPKAGTVSEDLEAVVKELMAGRFEFKNDKQGNVHSIVGKLSFGEEKLEENINYFIQQMKAAKPSGVKGGKYITSVFVCNAMGPGIRIDFNAA
ncbi:50S ribosomal protein L1 [Candidatus Gracilibacteria bacterium]|nr:50S ribosomal protein L1 [Candidatus Gracilibacteria bacterium]